MGFLNKIISLLYQMKRTELHRSFIGQYRLNHFDPKGQRIANICSKVFTKR